MCEVTCNKRGNMNQMLLGKKLACGGKSHRTSQHEERAFCFHNILPGATSFWITPQAREQHKTLGCVQFLVGQQTQGVPGSTTSCCLGIRTSPGYIPNAMHTLLARNPLFNKLLAGAVPKERLQKNSTALPKERLHLNGNFVSK